MSVITMSANRLPLLLSMIAAILAVGCSERSLA